MAYDDAVAERIRRFLAGRPGVLEKRMVGGLSFSLNGNMCCGVSGDALMVRVGREERDWALTQPHVRPMVFGGRALSGFVLVEPDGFRSDEALATWVQRGLDFVATLPGKTVAPRSSAAKRPSE